MHTSPQDTGLPAATPPAFALLGAGFRPFFLLAALFAAIGVPLWVAFLHGTGLPRGALSLLAWHQHEMLYGFVAAAIAGFLLTAVPSWTGRPPLSGAPLLALVLLWLAGRAAMGLPLGLGPASAAAIDLAFLPALALTVTPALLRGAKKNLLFLLLLALLFVANWRFHFPAPGAGVRDSLLPAIGVVLLMVTVVGGRVTPAFTAGALRARGLDVRMASSTALEVGVIAATIAVLLVDVFAPGGAVAGAVALVAAIAHGLRLARWHGHRTGGDALVWSLHVAYAWIPLALALKAASMLGGLAIGAGWMHALTSGAFATMIMAVMSRAALGHTGRPLVAPPAVVAALVLITLTALVRVFGPALAPAAWSLLLVTAGTLWTLAFVLFLFTYAPILVGPRADGRSG